jgi:hypothetical protein
MNIKADLSIDEVMALIEYNQKMADNIPQELYGQMTMAGHTLGVTAEKYRTRAQEWDDLLNRTWPK